MPGVDTAAAITAPHDDLDDLYDYSVDAEDVFRDFQPTMDAPLPNLAPTRPKPADLGIDEEIQVIKKRVPIAKLDGNRLLSPAGIPKLRRITKERLKFKGKGHEYSDVARLLNLYQLWLDDLYPRAKFEDGLAIIEKLGHSKRMQIMRREWINEGKPEDVDADEPEEESVQKEPLTAANAPGVAENLEIPAEARDGEKEDVSMVNANGKDSLFVSDDEDDAQPPEDDLDQLLAEGMPEEPPPNPSTENVASSNSREDFEDEMEAMAGMDGMW